MVDQLSAPIAAGTAIVGAVATAQVAFRKYLVEAFNAEQRIMVDRFLEFAYYIHQVRTP
jgi:hypothetical protein